MSVDLILLAGDIDDVPTELSQGMQWAFRLLIAVFLFGIALDSKPDDFRAALRRPGVFGTLLVTQYAVLPLLTLGLLVLLDPHPSVALGMIFVICCPSGSVSNLITHRARGDVALSVSLTAVSNLTALVATPAAFAFWGSLYPDTDRLLTSIRLDPGDMAIEILILLGAPFALGIWVAHRWPDFTDRMRRPVEIATLVFLVTLAAGALAGRIVDLAPFLGAVAGAVLLQNALSFIIGYGAGRISRLPEPGLRAMTIEIGMRNTGLALVLVLAYFDGLGGAILLVATWAVWDVVFGLLLAGWWRRRPMRSDQTQQPTGNAA
ncbi:bile acid:sodium symporter family protein [Nocardioides sambongensis]|uniref:bile acid:sodium symporter family protein n=1 Tax=Nocardioides sambongensis TaxID=2589074 RepID=UPI0011295DC4|nr:bile acid:sodium symporter family protein [Nocardioides sambongensis]